MQMPAPHREKLFAVLANDKLPKADRPRIELAVERYERWRADLANVAAVGDEAITAYVSLLHEYKRYFDLDVIFDSDDDFLYRQKGQLKLDNSIIEEFLPWLLRENVVRGISDTFTLGPANSYSSIYFESSLRDQRPGAGIHVRTKDQDFAVARQLFVKASHTADYSQFSEVKTCIAYVATEIKTNLDKTMFQEACATARDVRMAVPAARYFVMCEWLDMTPVSTAPTDIEEVLILRGGKRLSSNIRKDFSGVDGRRKLRSAHAKFLDQFPFRADVFKRWVGHIQRLLMDGDPMEADVLQQGYF